MKNKIPIYLAVGGLLALAAGCGKTENTTPSTKEADQPTSGVTIEPRPAEKVVAQATDSAKTTPVAAAPPANEAIPKMVSATNAATENLPGAVSQSPTTLADLSQAQMVQGLEAALAKGLQQAIARLGHDGGFLTNLNVKIPMPEQMQKVETTLRAMKQDKLADDFVTTMNRAAEQAVPAAGGVFTAALKQMTIEDATAILSGANDAATAYFRKATQTNLYSKFYPIVQKATEQTGVTAAYKTLMAKGNVIQGLGSFGSALSGTLLGKDSLDIDAYVTTKALDGLFQMVAAEEQQIRQNPIARTTATLQQVFGALQK
ncbi:MAG: DUF4197 domain-containing protein [Verrucomicrobiota bacterium]|nr:DUF4197 domain-containing protein [Limisphaerales bacterium]